MAAREFNPRPTAFSRRLDDIASETDRNGMATVVMPCSTESPVTEPVRDRAGTFLAWILSRRDAERGQLAIDWPELASSGREPARE